MLHQAQKPWQVVRVHALFVQGQHEVAARRAQCVVGILDALGDPAECDHCTDVIVGQEGGERVVGDLGIDGHQGRLVNASSFRRGCI